jgi:PKD repeat protein
MWQDSTYRKQLACRWLMLRQNTFRTDSFMTFIDTMAAHLDEAQGRNFTIWPDLGAETYTDQIDSLKSFLTRRLAWIDSTLAQENVSIPNFYLPTDTVLCNGGVFNAAYNGTQFSYNWQPGPDTSLITISQNGVYNLLVTDAYGCYSSKSMEVTLSQPDASFTLAQIGTNSFSWSFTPTDTTAMLYNWEFGDATTSSQMSPIHIYNTDGTFMVSLTIIDTNGCPQVVFDTIQFTVIIINGTENEALFDGNIYPNPFQERIQVDFSTPVQANMQISLVNELGQKTFSQAYKTGTQSLAIPTKGLSQGIYILKIEMGNKVWRRKVVKM